MAALGQQPGLHTGRTLWSQQPAHQCPQRCQLLNLDLKGVWRSFEYYCTRIRLHEVRVLAMHMIHAIWDLQRNTVQITRDGAIGKSSMDATTARALVSVTNLVIVWLSKNRAIVRHKCESFAVDSTFFESLLYSYKGKANVRQSTDLTAL